MLTGSRIRNILQNKEYFANGFYKNEFREYEGKLQIDDGRVISFESVEERMEDEENYFDPLYHILEMEKEVNEDYYSNIVFFNKCDADGYLDGFDINGYNEYGFNKKGFNKKGYDVNGYNKKGFNKKGYDVMRYDVNGYNRKGYNRKGYSRWGGSYLDDVYDPDGYDVVEV